MNEPGDHHWAEARALIGHPGWRFHAMHSGSVAAHPPYGLHLAPIVVHVDELHLGLLPDLPELIARRLANRILPPDRHDRGWRKK